MRPRIIALSAGAHLPAAAGGWAAQGLGVPLPWLIGSLVTVAALALSGLAPPALRPVRNCGVAVLLTGVGLTFTPEAAAALAAQGWQVLAASAGTVLIACLSAPLLERTARIGPRTAYFCCMPGGPAEMSMLGERFGAAPAPIAMAQLMRIVTLVATLPPLMAWSGFHGAIAGGHAHPGFDPAGAAGTLALSAALSLGLRRAGLASAFLIGPLAVGCGLAMSGLAPSAIPHEAMAAGQVISGVCLGAQFDRERMRAMRRFLPAAMANVALLTTSCAALGWALHHLTPDDAPTMVLATAPGSVAEMALTAEALSLNTPLVMAYHVVRIFLVMLLAVPLFRLMLRLGLMPPEGPAASGVPAASPVPQFASPQFAGPPFAATPAGALPCLEKDRS